MAPLRNVLASVAAVRLAVAACAVWAVAGATTARSASWIGRAPSARVDVRDNGTGDGATPPPVSPDGEWVAWDAGWFGAASVAVTLERPDGTVETLGGGEAGGDAARGIAAWSPAESERGVFILRLEARDADGTVIGRLVARRAAGGEGGGDTDPEALYAAWIAARGGVPADCPPDGDADSDGAGNWDEFVADTDPFDPDDVFHVHLAVADDGTLLLAPSSASPDRRYRAWLRNDLTAPGEWIDLGPGRDGLATPFSPDGAPRAFGAIGVSLPQEQEENE